MDALKQVAEQLPKGPVYQFAALRPDVLQALRATFPPQKILGFEFMAVPRLCGMVAEPKAQEEACWIFKDRKAFRDYLSGKLSESDLRTLAIAKQS